MSWDSREARPGFCEVQTIFEPPTVARAVLAEAEAGLAVVNTANNELAARAAATPRREQVNMCDPYMKAVSRPAACRSSSRRTPRGRGVSAPATSAFDRSARWAAAGDCPGTCVGRREWMNGENGRAKPDWIPISHLKATIRSERTGISNKKDELSDLGTMSACDIRQTKAASEAGTPTAGGQDSGHHPPAPSARDGAGAHSLTAPSLAPLTK